MQEIKIEKNVPIPTGNGPYPLKDMEIGDSFFVPNKSHNSISGYTSSHRPKKFTVMKCEENGIKGLRVWRIK